MIPPLMGGTDPFFPGIFIQRCAPALRAALRREAPVAGRCHAYYKMDQTVGTLDFKYDIYIGSIYHT